MNEALVTGGSGFIGRALCGRLRGQGVRVRALMRRAVEGPWDEPVFLDLASDDLPDSVLEGVDTVFHLAGKAHAVDEPGRGDDEHRRITELGTERLLAAVRTSEVRRVVFFSSVKAGGEGGPWRIDETAPDAPESDYGRARLAAERLILGAAADTGRHAVVLRLTPVYGRGCKGNLLRMLDSIRRGRFPPPPEFGNKRSMVHVEDVVTLALAACGNDAAAGQRYLVTDGEAYSTRQIYDMMTAALGYAGHRWSVPRIVLRAAAGAGDVIGRISGRRFALDSESYAKLSQSAWYDNAKAVRELGYAPRYRLPAALPDMIAELP